MKQHLDEILRRGTRSIILLSVVFFSCFYFSNQIYDFITEPILAKLPPDTKLIATQVTAPFMVPMQLSLLCSLLACAPYILYQIWMFVKPGLYQHERRNITPIIITSCLLFYSGIIFAVLVICPVALKFFTTSGPKNIQIMLDMGNFIDFIVTVSFASGLAFQIPIVTNLLIRSGVITKQQLAAKRRHVIVLALVLGMLLAPPDVISQIFLAIPMWALFELGLLFTTAKTSCSDRLYIHP